MLKSVYKKEGNDMHSRRRRVRRGYYRQRNRGSKVKLNFAPVIVILCLSIGCGYAAAKYVVDPVVNYVPQMTAEKEDTNDKADNKTIDIDSEQNKIKEKKKPDVIEDEVEVKEKGDISGYALQFGCYSSKAAAEAAMPAVGISGLQVIEQSNMYKIVGEVYKTKDEAKAALGELPDTVKSFVTTVYE